MKLRYLGLLTLAWSAPWAGAQSDEYSTQYPANQDLNQLVAAIALYPDPLVALILPATTLPDDIIAADQYLGSGGDPAGIDSQPWDPSVRSLAHYPQLVTWLNQNPQWTQAMGQAFSQDPGSVMQAIQQVRAQARASGVLTDTPQQRVIVEGDQIAIEPAQPDVIYVPEYDPEIIYDRPRDYQGPFLMFSTGFPVGFWLNYQMDWGERSVWVGRRDRDWREHRDWDHHDWDHHDFRRDGGQAWRPDERGAREQQREWRNRPQAPNAARPRPMPGAPIYTHRGQQGSPSAGAAPQPGPQSRPSPRPEVRPAAPRQPGNDSRQQLWPQAPRPEARPQVPEARRQIPEAPRPEVRPVVRPAAPRQPGNDSRQQLWPQAPRPEARPQVPEARRQIPEAPRPERRPMPQGVTAPSLERGPMQPVRQQDNRGAGGDQRRPAPVAKGPVQGQRPVQKAPPPQERKKDDH